MEFKFHNSHAMLELAVCIQIVYKIAVNYDMTFCVTKIKYIMYNVQDYSCLCNDAVRSVICED